MSIKQPLLPILLLCLLSIDVDATELIFSSGESQVSVIELYTSEGCSSCPTADKWLNKFQDSDLLWKKVIPLAFHVDYWDYLGWEDKLADARFAQRQRHYQKMKYVSAVYTPGIMKNGREWRGWRWWQDATTDETNKPGVLSAELNSHSLSVSFDTKLKSASPYILNVALLGVDLKSAVKAGENRGEFFEHDFVVLGFDQYQQTQNNSWKISNPIPQSTTTSTNKTNSKIDAIAIWITKHNDQTPIQATGTWIAHD